MIIAEIIQTYLTNIRQMLEDMKKCLENAKKDVEVETQKIVVIVSKAHIFDSFDKFTSILEEQAGPFLKKHNKLLHQLALVESMIQKLSQPSFELTDREETFLSRLFLASKLGSPEPIRLELGEYLKKLKLMSDIIYLTLSRYKGITTMWNSECSWYVVRAHLCQTRKGQEFYDTGAFNYLTWDIKPEKENDYDTLAKELAVSALEYCVENLDIFKQCFSDFNFEKLMSDFEGCVSNFSEQFPIPIIDFVFSQEKSESSNQLLESLLTLESTFLDEKKKLQTFYKQFQAFLKEISEKLTPILYQQREYETRDFRDCHRAHSGYRYVELYPELKNLIVKLTAVLENKCQDTCKCNHLTSEDYRQMKRPDLYPEIVHTKVVMTPVEKAKVDELVREFFARFP
jgi:hypothetical protein